MICCGSYGFHLATIDGHRLLVRAGPQRRIVPADERVAEAGDPPPRRRLWELVLSLVDDSWVF